VEVVDHHSWEKKKICHGAEDFEALSTKLVGFEANGKR
jgi:hypothetical protein